MPIGVFAVSIGVKQAQETLRTALAMGADRAILIVAADDVHTDIEPLSVAKLLKQVTSSLDKEGLNSTLVTMFTWVRISRYMLK